MCYRKENSMQAWLNDAAYRARQKGIEFNLSPEDITTPSHCPILNIPLEKSKGYPADNSPSIDRIGNNKGYTPDNIIIISHRANQLKKNTTIEKLISLYGFYKRINLMCPQL